MKPPPFQYHDPRSVEEAVELLSTHENAKLLAGGQSLMPMLNMRFVLPDHVIDLNRVSELFYIREDGTRLEIGAMTRQRELEDSEVLGRRCPLMHEALQQVGHRQTRNRGTIGGSLCHLDPAAELPAVAAALEATIHVQSGRGKRALAMAEFPAFFMTPAIEPDEIVTAVSFEPWPVGHGFAFVEFARRPGDFAIVGVAVLLCTAADRTIRRASIALGGLGAAPVRCAEAERMLIGAPADAEAFEKAAEVCGGLQALGDAHVSQAYRQHLAHVLTVRALEAASGRAAPARRH